MSSADYSNVRPESDAELVAIADYVLNQPIDSPLAYETAWYDVLDTIGCGILALSYPECRKLLGPIVPGTEVPCGVRVPGTAYRLDPVKAAFDIGAMVRWLDFNDTWLAAEWGHPSDNLGGILALADYLSQRREQAGEAPLLMQDVLTAVIKAHEIQGVLALENSFNRVGLDHVVLVKVASSAVLGQMLGLSRQAVIDVVAQAWVDGQSLRTYRHAPNTGSRKSWAAGDATSRALRLALMTKAGEKGCPSVLTAPKWGFCDVLFKGETLKRERDYGSYVMENILFKIAFPAEFHAQTAAECAIALHPSVKTRLQDIERIEVTTQEPAMRIINKTGPLYNPADRDHCLQYIIAVGLRHGELTAEHYEDEAAADPALDALREKMVVQEDKSYTADYYAADKRAIANAVQVFFKDGTATERHEIHYPVGHLRRREEGIPQLKQKFSANLATHYTPRQCQRLETLCFSQESFTKMPVHRFMEAWIVD